MNVWLKGRYQSLTAFEWNDIPPFAVLTGPNGSGKTQLLRAIHAEVKEHAPPPRASPQRSQTPQQLQQEQNKVYVEGFYTPQNSVSLIQRGQWDGGLKIGPRSMNEIQTRTHKLHQDYLRIRDANTRNTKHGPLAEYPSCVIRIANELSKAPADLTEADFVNNLGAVDLPPRSVQECNIATIFYAYRAKQYEALTQNVSPEEFVEKNGEPPWQSFQRLLDQFGLPITVTDPSNVPVTGRYECKLILQSDSSVNANYATLSSGEQVLLSIVMWLFNAYQIGVVPQLLLLDEPDAHLHPSLTKKLMDALVSVLCDKHGVRVIMTTHSPSTVALCPADSVFLMTRTPTRIQPIDRQEAIARLTDNVVSVTPGVRVVLVEDRKDKVFYEEVFGQTVRDERVPSSPPLLFMSAGIDRNESGSGGRTAVEKWIEKIGKVALTHLLVGLVDRDESGESVVPNVLTIGRYCHENYLLDPIVVYATLMNSGKQPNINGIDIELGFERQLKTIDQEKKQAIADAIHRNANLVSTVQPTSNESTLVGISLGAYVVNYPSWLLTRSGKDLFQMYLKVFDKTMTYESLFKAFRRVSIIPEELVSVLRNCQLTPTEEAETPAS